MADDGKATVVVQAPSEVTDSDKRDIIVDSGVGANTAAGLTGDALNKAYREAQRRLEEGLVRNMGGTIRDMPGYMGGGMMDEKLGYTRGGMAEEKRGPIKYSKGGAVKGRNYRGSF
jgi:predicted butyrate kinase (DUF1464 family)|tara:strand:+ start:415 stop:762 length:348 start_codon:yes stop_codon:yes gene_type:complete